MLRAGGTGVPSLEAIISCASDSSSNPGAAFRVKVSSFPPGTAAGPLTFTPSTSAISVLWSLCD